MNDVENTRAYFGRNGYLPSTYMNSANNGVSTDYSYGLVQERRNSIAKALELRLSCTDPLIWTLK